MDSLTQIALGAAVAEVAVGKKVGRKASFYGAVLGTLPDLDVFWLKNAVDSFTEHRSVSHSLLIFLIVSPVLALLLKRWHPISKQNNDLSSPEKPISLVYWCLTVYLIFATHALLDWFTIYGTQLFWPLSHYPFGLGSIFIIDPIYTLALVIPLLITLFKRNQAVVYGIVASCLYLAWSVFAQHWQNQRMENALLANNIQAERTLTIPTPLNTLLWKQIALVDDGYWVSYASVFDSPNSPIQAKFFANENHKLRELAYSKPIAKLQFFTKDFYAVKEIDQGLLFADLRMGSLGRFVFTFKVAERSRATNTLQFTDVVLLNNRPQREHAEKALKSIGKRIFNEHIDLFTLH